MPSRRLLRVLFLVLPALAACGGGGPPTPAALAYDLPRTPEALYETGDTAVLSIDAGMQTLAVEVGFSALVEMDFAPADDGGVRVTATVGPYSGRLTNPMTPPVTAEGPELEGPLIFRLDRRGVPTPVELPDLEGVLGSFLRPSSLAMTFFPRLPGRAVDVGATWGDTVRLADETEAGSLHGTSVVTYTVAGDTTVAGHYLLRVDFGSEDERVLEGSQAGFQVRQELAGSSEGYFLWDLARGLLFESRTLSDLQGTMEVLAAPMPLPVRMESENVVRLRSGA